MGRLQPETSLTVDLTDPDHREDTPPVNQPPLAPPPPEVPVPSNVPSDHHEETLPPPQAVAAADVPDSSPPLPTDPASHHDEIQQLLNTPPAPKRHDDDDVDLLPAVAFPPLPEKQIVPYVEPAGGYGGSAHPPPAATVVNDQIDVSKPAVEANESKKDKPPHIMLIPFIGVPWTSGLFDCCQHPTNAILTTLAPCATFGQITEILDNGSTSCLSGGMLYFFLFLVICHWNIGERSRTRMRNAFGLAEAPVTDRIAHTMFPLCALCQEFRELKNRGYDPFLGYQGVIARIVHDPNQVMLKPPLDQPMQR